MKTAGRRNIIEIEREKRDKRIVHVRYIIFAVYESRNVRVEPDEFETNEHAMSERWERRTKTYSFSRRRIYTFYDSRVVVSHFS